MPLLLFLQEGSFVMNNTDIANTLRKLRPDIDKELIDDCVDVYNNINHAPLRDEVVANLAMMVKEKGCE